MQTRKTRESPMKKSKKIKKHNKAMWFKCCTCRKTFKFHSKLKNHMRKHTGEGQQQNQVTVRTTKASKAFKPRESYGCKHHRKHRGLQPYLCHQCKKDFETKAEAARQQSKRGTHAQSETVSKFLEIFSCTSKGTVNHLKMPWPHISENRQ